MTISRLLRNKQLDRGSKLGNYSPTAGGTDSQTVASFCLPRPFYWIFLAAIVLCGGEAVRAQDLDSVDRDYSAELPRFQPLSPADALKAFTVAEGFELELVASEPLVVDPVAAAFDGRYRLFVVEMRGYSEQADERLGRICLLSDNDHDGIMDHRTTFAQGLSWPTSVAVWQDGILVAEAPDIWFFADRNGDGIAEVKEKWFTGFGKSNVQGLVNSIRWSPRCRFHGATSSSSGNIDVDDAKLGLFRRDFTIDPVAQAIAPATGGGQHGLSFNAFGDKFVTSNSDHLQQIVDLEMWLSTTDSGLDSPPFRRSIAEDGPQATVYRASPVEPWRLVRTRLRTKGIVPGPVEGGGTAAGYFTGATGTCITDATQQFGREGSPSALVCDVGSNLVHRKDLRDLGLYWTANRIDVASELLVSTDTWFRPVQLEQGPDGSVYILDMYREVIEHPKSLPPVIKRHLDLTSGRDRGRIYRIRRKETDSSTAAPLQDSDSTSPASDYGVPPAELSLPQLADRLYSEVPWQRLTASRMLIEHAFPTDGGGVDSAKEVAQLIRVMLQRTSADSSADGIRISRLSNVAGTVAAIHCLAAIDSAGSLPFFRELLRSSGHPRVQQAVLRVLADSDQPGTAADLPATLSRTDKPRLQIQLARMASKFRSEQERLTFLSKLTVEAKEPIAKWAIAVAAGSEDWKLVRQVIRERSLRSAAPWLQLLLPRWMSESESDVERTGWLDSELRNAAPNELPIWIDATAELSMQELRAFQDSFQTARLPALLELAERLRKERRAGELFKALRLGGVDAAASSVGDLLRRGISEAANEQLCDLIRVNNSEALGNEIVASIPKIVPQHQQDLLRALAASPFYHSLLADGIENGRLPPSMIVADLRQRLASGNGSEASRFAKLFESSSSDRQQIVSKYSVEAEAAGDWQSGQRVFQQNCAQCHRLGGVGQDVGPALKDLGNKSISQLARSIFDPSGEVDPRYLSYSLLTVDDQAIVGIISDATGQQITIREAGGKQHKVSRQEVAQLKSNGRSLMPDGLEQQISVQQFADLVEFLKNRRE